MKIYGPYIRKDGRSHICIIKEDGTRQTKSYPRYILEQYLGRELSTDETVDHINNDYTDNRIENLQILPLTDNIQKQHKLNPRKQITFKCPICNKEITKWENYIKGNWKKGRSGPYCSRKCAGIASHM